MTGLSNNWGLLALRGLLAVLLGLAAFVWPGLTIMLLITMFGAYALVDGIVTVVAAATRRGGRRHWWSLIGEGVIGIVVGLLAFAYPGLTAISLIYVIAAWAVLTGIFEIAAAIRLRKEMEGEWMLALTGVISLLFGVMAAAYPVAGATSLIWLLGFYALAFGVLLITLAFRLRSRRERPDHFGVMPRIAPHH